MRLKYDLVTALTGFLMQEANVKEALPKVDSWLESDF